MNLHKVLSHPVRVLALREIRELGTASPVLVTQRSLETEGELQLNSVAYHFRVLAKKGVIELTDQVQRRGATEHVYRINPVSPVLALLRVTEMLEKITATPASEGPRGETFENVSGPVAIVPVQVDRCGQKELDELLGETKSNLEELTRTCMSRITGSDQEPVSMFIGLGVCELPTRSSSPVT